jgi:hypothetical protein
VVIIVRRIHIELDPLLRQEVTVHLRGPIEPVLLHNGKTTVLDPLADRTANRDGIRIIFEAYRGVESAEKEFYVRRALNVHEGPKLNDLEAGLFLNLVVSSNIVM